MWGATGVHPLLQLLQGISIHAPRVGRDSKGISIAFDFNRFQSTRPVWGATSYKPATCDSLLISIHAPRVGRDHASGMEIVSLSDFNPRAPCGARRRKRRHRSGHCRNFNPRAPCGARHLPPERHEEILRFQSTRPVWGATCADSAGHISDHVISIHAPRVGRDFAASGKYQKEFSYFNPRAPCGARLNNFVDSAVIAGFQSTRPVWGATQRAIHRFFAWDYFNPRAPCGARPAGRAG